MAAAAVTLGPVAGAVAGRVKDEVIDEAGLADVDGHGAQDGFALDLLHLDDVLEVDHLDVVDLGHGLGLDDGLHGIEHDLGVALAVLDHLLAGKDGARQA